MNNFIKNLGEKINKNNLFLQNIKYLTLLEGINVLVPLIILPYLLHTLGKEMYGLVIFAQATIYYFVLLQNFGLNTFAVKEISINRENKEKLSLIVSNVLFLKGIFFILSIVILWLIIQFIPPKFKGYENLFLLTMWMGLFDFIFPKWYFLGIEKMKYITYLNMFSKIVVVILIFTLIKSEKDYLMLPIIYGIGALLSGIVSLIIIFKYNSIKYKFSNIAELKKTLDKSVTFFISDISISFFAKSNKIIIGTVLGLAEVAYYDLAEKIIFALKNIPLHIIRDAIYPRVAKTRNIKIIHFISIIMGSYSIFVIILIAIFAPLIVTIIGGNDMLASANVLRVFSVSIFTTQISNYYITVGLWSLGHEKIFRNLMIYSTLVFLLLYGLLWITDLINIYTLTAIPTIVDIYLIIHTYFIYKDKKLI